MAGTACSVVRRRLTEALPPSGFGRQPAAPADHPRSPLPRLAALLAIALLSACAGPQLRGTGDLGVVIERASGQVQIIETSGRSVLAEIDGLGDLSHASVVFSRDGRFAFVFGRDGGLTKVDLLTARIAVRVVQAGNSIGGAISEDGRVVAVANYEPGGVRLFDADTLAPLGEVVTKSKVVGLADAPGQRFVFSLYDADAIWIADCADPMAPKVTRLEGIGHQPYDGLITPDGRYYIAGLFGEDGLALVDLWAEPKAARRILGGYGRGQDPLPVYKMPHLHGWAVAGRLAFVPAVGRHEVLVIDTTSWTEVGRIAVRGQPVFVMAQPDGRRVWVNFALPDNEAVQVIDVPTLAVVKTLIPGKGVLHMEFAPRGEEVWLSVRDEDKIEVYATATAEKLRTLPSTKPSGIFFTSRAQRIGF